MNVEILRVQLLSLLKKPELVEKLRKTIYV